MAIQLDGTWNGNFTTPVSITVASNNDRMLFVSYSHYQGSSSPSGITYNSVAMTKIVEQVGSFDERTSIWGLVAPDTGTHDVAVSGGGNWNGIGIISLYNAYQALPTNYNGVSDSTALSLTTQYKNSWVITSIESEASITIVDGTDYWNLEGQPYQHGAGAYILVPSPSARNMDWSQGYGSRCNQVNIEVRAINPPDPSFRLNINGGRNGRPRPFAPGNAR